MKFLTFLVLLIVLLIYAIIGGIIFRAIEINHEEELKLRTNVTISSVLGSNDCVNSSDILELEDIIFDLEESGVFVVSNGSAFFRSRFDIRSSILIACGLFAGFGIKNGVPVTVGGKIFTAFYGLVVGFYQYLVISVVGDLLDILLKYLYQRTTNNYKARTSSWFYNFRQLILSTVGFIFFIIIPAAIVNSIEFWSFGESLFFCIIYVITIGFGDYSPGSAEVKIQGEDSIQWYRMCVGFWLLIAIMWFAIIIYEFNSIFTGFAWRAADEIIDDGIEHIGEAIAKNPFRNSMPKLPPLRPLPPVPFLSPSPPLPPPSLSSSSSASFETSATARSLISDSITFPHVPSFSIVGQESSGDVSVIKF